MRTYQLFIFLLSLLLLAGCTPEATPPPDSPEAGAAVTEVLSPLCDLYLQVLEDLWERDPALNDGINHLSIDLSQAPGNLTEEEKGEIAQIFSARHGVEALTLSFEELNALGYLTSGTEAGEPPCWEDGILLSVTPSGDGQNEDNSTLHFTAEKWRSALGAYGFSDCTATTPWTDYTIGGEYIS